ncbi:MAG: ABC transporter substrate-binding protein [Hylemonella sp.]|uniref:ABC transporter substrate-binding protein n=1 Tax=Hylemonella sp. TaxID=2066020 RepID=UPI00391A0DA1
MFRPFILALAFALGASASASDRGVTPTEIRLGASVVLSGPLGPQTQEFGQGSRLYFDAVNAAGGVHGRKIVYTTLDDGFDVKRAVENTRQLIEEQGVFIIYNSTGTAQTGAILPLAEASRTIIFGPVTGATAFRQKVNPYLFHVRASYADEARRIVSHLVDTGISRVTVVYQDDGLGKTLLAELQQAASAVKIKLDAEVKIDPKAPDYAVAAAAAERAQPQAVLLGMAGGTLSSFIKATLKTSVRPSFYGFSIANVDLIRRDLQEQSRGIVLAQIMPPLRNTTIPVVAEYHRLLREKDPSAVPSAFQLEGFVHAKLLVEGLRRAGRNLSTASFIKAMEEAGEISFGRFAARYSPSTHNGSSYVELAIIDNAGQLRY